PIVRSDGSTLMMFKGRGYGNKFPYQTSQKLGIAYAKSLDHPFEVLNNDQPLKFDSLNIEFEDPFLWEDKTGLHVLVKDMTNKVTGEKHAGVLFHSVDGLTWRMDKQAKAYSRTLQYEGGKTVNMGQL